MPGDREWSGRYAAALSNSVNGIYLSCISLDAAFDENGRQINTLTARLTGHVEGVVALLNECGWQARSAQKVSLPHLYFLMARQGASGK
ncbi:hypothetical protein JNO12_24205 [Erwinia aphidicola]|nr:hypothetical protein [Erwinia aphidicola]